MFFIFSKIFQYIFSPTIWIIAIFIVSIFIKKQKAKKVLNIIGFSMLVFF